jgi:tetratricopeptide (TPR) repeat protein
VSTDDSKKNDGVLQGDWDSALDAWDQAPLSAELAQERDTPVPGTDGADPSPPKATPTARPPAGQALPDDEERTVVGEIPAELLADSMRGVGSASGLGHLLGRGSMPTVPGGEERGKDVDVAFDEEDGVVTSAPDVVRRAPTVPTAVAARPERAAGGTEDLDPFADLREAAPPARRPAPVQRPQPAQEQPATVPPPPDMPSPEAMMPSPPRPEVVDAIAMAPVGPKLLEPEQRRYASDEPTGVYKDLVPAEQQQRFRSHVAAVPADSGRGDKVRLVGEGAPVSAMIQSVAPAPPEPSAVRWDDEQEASSSISDQAREAIERRAAWLAEEAAAREDPAERARIMLAVSELCALVRDDEKSVAVASAARDLAPSNPLLHRQARHVALRDRNWYELATAIERETQAALSDEARCHGTLMLAELAGREQGDREAKLKLLDTARKIAPADPRAWVEGAVLALMDAEGEPSEIPVPKAGELAALAEAIETVRRVRRASTLTEFGDEAVGVYEAIPRARAALQKRDTVAAARSARALGEIRGLGPGATWLAAVLASQKPQSRASALAWFAELADGPHAGVARRMQALCAVAARDEGALKQALSTPGSSSFTAADRVATGVLFGGDLAGVRPFADSIVHDDDLAPLGWAAVSALAGVQGEQAVERVDAAMPGADAARASVMLGRAVVSGVEGEKFASLVQQVTEADPGAAVARLLGVDVELEARRPERLLEELASWAGAQDKDRDRALATGLVAELVGDTDRAMAEYDRAAGADARCEAPVRALGVLDKETQAARLAELARNAAESTVGAIHALESALRCDPDQDQAAHEVALRQCLELGPELPYATWLGERLARVRGDVDGAVEWLRMRREATQDAMEGAYDLCREAMLVLARDEGAASTLLGRASAARPQDVALRALYERFSADRPEDWVEWRLEHAPAMDPKDRVRFLVEACLELEHLGQMQEAAKAARSALETGASELARRCVERLELVGAGTSDLTDTLMQQARSEEGDPRVRREAQERLAELDERGRGDLASALLWHRTMLEETPAHLPSLRRLEHAFVGEGRDGDLEPIASELVRSLKGPEVDAHAVVATRVRLRESSWSSTRDLCEAAAQVPKPSLWALRTALAHARHAADAKAVVDYASALAARSSRESESATLLALAADALAHLGNDGDAVQNLVTALAREPNLFHAHRQLIDLLVKSGDHARAAEECEELARKSHVAEHQLVLWYRAGILWMDEVKDAEKGRRALEEACGLDITFADVFDRLKAIYIASNDTNELALLLERRLDVIEDPAERVEMQVLRGKVLSEVGETQGAKDALAAALDVSPDHVPALRAFSELCFAEGDWSSAEQALLRLGRLAQDVLEQADIYRKLAKIYLDHQPDYGRAEEALREVLKRQPDDVEAQGRLVDVFREMGDAPKAIELCTALLEAATTPEDKRMRTIQLALIHEQVEGDVKKAEQMLDKVFKQAPTSMVALRALAEFYKRQGNAAALKLLLDRASNDARRALRTGRFNRDLFAVIETVATVRSNEAAARAARAAVAALDGEEADIGAAGPRAFDPALDDLMAPDLLNASFRALLSKAGHMLDAAYPMDMTALRASPLPPTAVELQQAIVSTGAAIGLPGIDVLVSPALGPTCVPISSSPPRVVMGASLVSSPETAVRNFLVLRALKIVQTHACVLSRTAPIDLLPLVAAFVKTLVPSYSPSGVDPKRFQDAVARFQQHAPAAIDPSAAALALEISGSLDNRASTLNIAVNGWGDRVALLATGNLNTAMHAIAWAGGHPSGPPAAPKDRTTWIGRNAEARELIVFVASDEFQELCTRLGLG